MNDQAKPRNCDVALELTIVEHAQVHGSYSQFPCAVWFLVSFIAGLIKSSRNPNLLSVHAIGQWQFPYYFLTLLQTKSCGVFLIGWLQDGQSLAPCLLTIKQQKSQRGVTTEGGFENTSVSDWSDFTQTGHCHSTYQRLC